MGGFLSRVAWYQNGKLRKTALSTLESVRFDFLGKRRDFAGEGVYTPAESTLSDAITTFPGEER